MKTVLAIVFVCLALQTWNSQSITPDVTSSIATPRASAPRVSTTINAYGAAAAAHADAALGADHDDETATVTAATTPEIGDNPADMDGDVSADDDVWDGSIAETIDV
jgi:hypothetical protein